MKSVTEGTLLWTPPAELQNNSVLREYMGWLERTHGLTFGDYAALWDWSVANIEAFWPSIWDFFDVRAGQPPTQVLSSHSMPGARWFSGATLNYAEHVFRNRSTEHPAIVFRNEVGAQIEVAWDDLHRWVAAIAAGLRRLGVQRGDRVVAYLPNIPEAVIAFLATASLGAIWSSCSPDMGEGSVKDRFSQIEPKVLFAVDGYHYGGTPFDRRAAVDALRHNLPTLEHTVLVPYLDQTAQPTDERMLLWAELGSPESRGNEVDLAFEQVPFEHPLWVLYSSGTTGLPKPIVHGHGGILLEHLKVLGLHLDLRPGDRFFWFTTTGWMMWNFLISGLLRGCTIVLYDGSPGYPDMGALWEFAAQSRMNVFGTSAAYIAACMKAGITPGATYDLSQLRCLGSTGSPLPVDGFQWVYEQVKPDIWLISTSGGTDVCTAFVGGCALLPVYAGEIQCRCLGCKIEAFDDHGQPVIDHVGELVITEPLPSMPLFFWNDPEQQRYRDSYFALYPGIWRHGDWVKITPRGGVVIYGRSDSTINRMGVRFGTSELYRAVEGIPDVLDSLVIDLEGLGGKPYMPLFVVLRAGATLDDALRATITQRIRETLSPRHVPDDIFVIPEVPRTLNGKKLEVPIKKILAGVAVETVANPDAMSNPHTLAYFAELAEQLNATPDNPPNASVQARSDG